MLYRGQQELVLSILGREYEAFYQNVTWASILSKQSYEEGLYKACLWLFVGNEVQNNPEASSRLCWDLPETEPMVRVWC